MSEGFERIIPERPDVNTAEATLYGSKYLWMKATDYFWDQVEEQLEKELDEQISKIRDLDFAVFVLKRRPDMIWYRNNPPTNKPAQLMDLRTIREAVIRGTSLRKVKYRRQSNEMYARLHGIAEYTAQSRDRGVSESAWKSATLNRSNDPITYEAVRTLAQDREQFANADAARLEQDRDYFRQQQDLFQQQYDEYLEETSMPADPFEDGGYSDGDADEYIDELAIKEQILADIPIIIERDPTDDSYWDEREEGDAGEKPAETPEGTAETGDRAEEPAAVPVKPPVCHWTMSVTNRMAETMIEDYRMDSLDVFLEVCA